MADEKDEKSDEKEREKSEEKSAEEKWRRDPLGAIIWACILIWAGLVWLADNLGYLENVKRLVQFRGPDWLAGSIGVWGVILAGVGGILLVEVLVRLVIPAYRRSVTGTLILAVILIWLGVGNLTQWDVIWPLVLIAIGASIVLRAIFRAR